MSAFFAKRYLMANDAVKAYSSDEDRLARGEYLAKHVTLSLALRSSGDAGRGFGRG